ncbi:MAG TPA: WbqC family protein, partial [Arenimonas sp.]|nr:WbqC family protein [Arenimonas sp.]
MIAAIVQPYLLPYIGYLQLMAAVDAFVFLDDVQYIARGWVNRNRILNAGRVCWLTVPVRHAHQQVAINQRFYDRDPHHGDRIANLLAAAYPGPVAEQLSRQLLLQPMIDGDGNVAEVNAGILRTLAAMLGMRTTFHC